MGMDYRSELFVGVRITREEAQRLFRERPQLFARPKWKSEESWSAMGAGRASELLECLKLPRGFSWVEPGDRYDPQPEDTPFIVRDSCYLALEDLGAKRLSPQAVESFSKLSEAQEELEELVKDWGLGDTPGLYNSLTLW